MNDWLDFFEIAGHMGFTTLSWCLTHWNGIGGAILMVLQAAYLIKKLRSN